MAFKWWPCPECCAAPSSSYGAGGPIFPPSECCGVWPLCVYLDVSGVLPGELGIDCECCDDYNAIYRADVSTICPCSPGSTALGSACYRLPFITSGCVFPCTNDHVLEIMLACEPGGAGYVAAAARIFRTGCLPGTPPECLTWWHEPVLCGDLDGLTLIQGLREGDCNFRQGCNPLESSAKLIFCPDEDDACCGTDTPKAGSTCKATIAGTGGCSGNPVHPDDGVVNMFYAGRPSFSPCTGFSFGSGTMKWLGDSGPYLLIVECTPVGINVQFWFYQCSGGVLVSSIVWTGSAAFGSCDLGGMVLTLAGDAYGCVDPGSTVTLSDFVF